jgi:hypothetical protein
MYNLDPIQYPSSLYDYVDDKVRANPVVLIAICLVILVYYFLSSSLVIQDKKGLHRGVEYAGLMFQGESSSSAKFAETFIWGVFLLLIFANAFSYFFKINIKTAIQNLFSPQPEIDIVVDQSRISEESKIPQIRLQKQVFHVPENNYTYEESKAVCEAYGATLATYDQIEDAYNKGAEWCGYGWSDSQQALFPTQRETWQKLQGIKGHEHDCGRTGVNGGYIGNPNVRFGVNCYGYKPFITPEEERIMAETRPYPITKRDIKHERKVDKYRNKLDKIHVSPFNKSTWSVV